jgi:hypothetical protein
MNKDFSPLELYNLDDETLDYALSLTEEAKLGYFHNLISKYYSDEKLSPEQYKDLQIAYRSSFILEKIYRSNKIMQKGFRPVYTRTGLIRELVNDLYFLDTSVNIH